MCATEEAPPRATSWEEAEALLSGRGGEGKEDNICALYRAIFCTRQAAPSQSAAVALLVGALSLRRPGESDNPGKLWFSSVLFRHECCYLLGQLGADCLEESGRKQAYDCLYRVLLDETEDEVTRHEAAEGIAAVHSGAQGSGNAADAGAGGGEADEHDEGRAPHGAAGVQSSEMFLALDRLARHGGGRGPLAETCFLATEGIRRRNTRRVCACQYASHDPAIGDPAAGPQDVPRYSRELDGEGDLFQRYVAMFTLRNLGASKELAAALDGDRSSVVLRHELAFVLGQLEDDEAVAALIRSLGNKAEHAMVRHEAAIALGSIGGDAAKAALKDFTNDPEAMVSESCLVALDTAAYWEAWERVEARMRQQQG